MRKILSMILSLVMILSFASCEIVDQLKKPETEKLKTPVIEIVDITSSGFTVQWEAVKNAESYIVELDGTSYTTKKTSYTFNNLDEDTYTVRVWASASGYQPSDYAQMAVKVTGNGGGSDQPTESKLATPSVSISDVSETGFTAKWNNITGADKYTVNCNGKSYSTTNTSYTFNNLEAGNYVVKVKASGSGYKDSDYGEASVTISGATTACWFSQSIAPAELDESNGYAPYNALEFNWEGSGVESLYYGLFYAEDAKGVDDSTIISNLEGPVKDEIIDSICSAGGFSSVFSGLDSSTEFLFCTYVTFVDGTTQLKKSYATTDAAELDTASWYGTWEVKSTKMYSINQNGQGSYVNQADTFTVTIAPNNQDPDYVIIDGFSVLGLGFETLGLVDGDTLRIYNGIDLGENEDGSFNFYWIGWYNVDGVDDILSDTIPSNIVTLNGTTATSTNEFTLEYSDGTPASVKCYCSDVFGVSPDGNIYFLIDEFPGVYRTGNMTWTKKSDSYDVTRSLDVACFNHKAIKSALNLR
jgi:hypothetical protein